MDDGAWHAIDQSVRTRRSIWRFTDRPVSKRLLIEVLDIARRAPSNSNMQPWRVYLVGGAAKDKLAEALSEAHRTSPADYQPERPMYAPIYPPRTQIGDGYSDACSTPRWVSTELTWKRATSR
jgi:nitroreductase